ncbi:unnamed protein product [Fraxinus pennsylvanica]|uniref:RanBD1 domain-containing protein n=1 Tax=Fraxinus pennsylvanica TaxID=56036 RepID=A0AAD1ZB04_9LAMI|nr:unnamed protein product [Fraxinus pennsylvanica]
MIEIGGGGATVVVVPQWRCWYCGGADNDGDDSKLGTEDKDTGAQVAPIVKLQEVDVTTGEENEDILLDLKAKLYRFDKEGSQWKERGVGTLKLLKPKESDKIRLVTRQNKTLKICANHLVLHTMTVQEHQGNDKSYKIEEITESLAKTTEDSEEGTTAANLIEKLTVESKDTEEKQETKEASKNCKPCF